MTPEADCYLHGSVRAGESGWVLERERETIPLSDPDGLLDGREPGDGTVGVDVVSPRFVGVDDEPIGVRCNGDRIVLVGERRMLDTLFDRPVSRVGDLTFDPGCWPVAPENATVRTTNSPSALPLRRIGREQRVRIEAAALDVREFLTSPDPFGSDPIDSLGFEFHPTRDRVRIAIPGLSIWANHGWLECSPRRFFERVGEWATAAIDGEPSPWHHGSAPMTETLDFEYGVEVDALRIRPILSATPLGIVPGDGLRFDRTSFARAWVRDTRQFLAETDPDEADSLRASVRSLASRIDDVGTERTVSPAVDTGELVRVASRDPQCRRSAIEALVERGAAADLRDLRPVLQDPGDRWLLADALGRIGGPSAAAGLLELLREDPIPGVREAIDRSLDGIDPADIASALTGGSEDGTPEGNREGVEMRLKTASVPEVRAHAARALPVVAETHPWQQLLDALRTEDDADTRSRITEVLSSVQNSQTGRSRTGIDGRFHDRELALLAGADHPDLREERMELVPVPEPPSRSRVVEGLTDRRPAIRELSAIAALEFPESPLYGELFDLVEDPDASDSVAQRAAESIATLADVSSVPPQGDRLFEAYREAARSTEAGVHSLREALETLSTRYGGGDFFGVDPTWLIAAYHDAIVTDEYWLSPTTADDVVERVVAGAGTDRLLSEIRTNPERGYRVARLLGRCDSEPVVELLTALLEHDDLDVADAALESLLRIGPGYDPSVLGLEPASDNRALRLASGLAAEWLGTDPERFDSIVPSLLAVTRAEEWYWRAKGIEMLTPVLESDRVLDRIATIARSDTHVVPRRIAAHALSYRDDDRSRSTLRSLLKAEDSRVRKAAADALTNSMEVEVPEDTTTETEGDDEAGAIDEDLARELCELLPTANRELWRTVVESVRPHVGNSGIEAAFATAINESALSNDSAAVRKMALRVLPQLRENCPIESTTVVETAAEAFASDVNPEVRSIAATVLVHCRTPRAYDALDRIAAADTPD